MIFTANTIIVRIESDPVYIFSYCADWDKVPVLGSNVKVGSKSDPRILDISEISKTKRSGYYGVAPLQNFQITLDNADGYFDDIDPVIFENSEVVVRHYAQIDYSDGSTIPQNKALRYICESYRFDNKYAYLTLTTPNKYYTDEVLTYTYSDTEFPDIKPNLIGKPIPKILGQVFNAPVDCTNELAVSGNYYFIINLGLDNIYYNTPDAYILTNRWWAKFPFLSLDAVYVDGVEKTPVSVSSTKPYLTIELTPTDVGGKFRDVTVDVTMVNTNPAELIKTLLTVNINNRFTIENLDLYNEAYAANYGYGILINKPIKYMDLINKIAMDCNFDLILGRTDTQTYNLRKYNASRTPIKILYSWEYIDDVSFDSGNLERFDEMYVEFAPDIKNNSFQYYRNTSYVNNNIKYHNSKTKQTYLLLQGHAQSVSNELLSIHSVNNFICTRTIKYNFIDTYDVGDFLVCSPKTRREAEDIWGIWEVLSMSDNLILETRRLTLRFVQSTTLEEWAPGYLIDEFGNFIADENGRHIIVKNQA